MTVAVTAKVKWVLGTRPSLPADVRVIVRKVELDDQGRMVGKYGLSKTGEWLPVGEGVPYPDECELPVKYHCRFEGEEEI